MHSGPFAVYADINFRVKNWFRLLMCIYSVVNSVKAFNFFTFINVAINSTANITYCVVNNIARCVPDTETVLTLGFDPNLVPALTIDEFKERDYDVGDSIKLISYKSKTSDDILAAFILRSDTFNGILLSDFHCVGDYVNPSIGEFRGRLFMATSLQMGLSGTQKKIPTNRIEFRWVNTTKYSFQTSSNYLGVANEIQELNQTILGQDPRMIIYNETYIQLFFTSLQHYGLQAQRMGTAELQVSENDNSIQVKILFSLYFLLLIFTFREGTKRIGHHFCIREKRF